MRLRNYALSLAFAGVLLGCESDKKPTTQPLTFRERQDRALRDPMNYKPDFSEDRISSGSIFDFDKKGFKKDMDSAFNP